MGSLQIPDGLPPKPVQHLLQDDFEPLGVFLVCPPHPVHILLHVINVQASAGDISGYQDPDSLKSAQVLLVTITITISSPFF